MLKKLLKDEQGQGLVEYNLVLALVGVVSVVALTSISSNLKNVFTTIRDTLTIATPIYPK